MKLSKFIGKVQGLVENGDKDITVFLFKDNKTLQVEDVTFDKNNNDYFITLSE